MGRFPFSLRWIRSNVPSNNPKLLQAVPDLLEVLRDPVFDHLGAVPDLAQMGIYPTYHGLRFVTEFAGDGVGRDRRAAIERLQPGGTVGVPKHLRAQVPGREPGAGCNAIGQSAHVLDRLFTL